jgi:hypothetical protein
MPYDAVTGASSILLLLHFFGGSQTNQYRSHENKIMEKMKINQSLYL